MNFQEFVPHIPPQEGKPHEHDSVVFDEFGLHSLLCHSCGILVGGRTYVEVRSRVEVDKTEKAMVVIRYANYCEKEVQLSNGSVMKVAICVDCRNVPVPLNKVMNQVKRAWMKENIHAGYSEEQLLNHHNRTKDLTATKDTGKVHLPWKRREPNERG